MARTTKVIAFILLVGIARLARAGEWDCDNSRQFHLDTAGAEHKQASKEQRAWVDSLIANLRRQGGEISYVDVFVRSSAKLTLNRESTDCPIFQSTSSQTYFISCADLVVDFAARQIIAGVGSRHVSPSKSVVAIVHPTEDRNIGVPVGACLTPPLFLWNPWFHDSEVWWY